MIVHDISNNNAEPSYRELRRAGQRGIYMKASEGRTYHDPTVTARRQRARAAGLKVGLYHFARPDLHPGKAGAVAEAHNFVAVLGRLGARDLVPTLDFETRGKTVDEQTDAAAVELLVAIADAHAEGGLYGVRPVDASTRARATAGGAALVAWARDFNRVVHDACRCWPLFYSYSSFIRALDARVPIGGGLWIADYGANDGRRHPVAIPSPWKHYRLHQFTSRYRSVGHLLDANYAPNFSALYARRVSGAVAAATIEPLTARGGGDE